MNTLRQALNEYLALRQAMGFKLGCRNKHSIKA